MPVHKRWFAALFLLLGVLGLSLSLAGGAGVWIIQARLTATVTRVFARIDAALDVAEGRLEQIQASLTRAAECLDHARQEQMKINHEPPRNSALRRGLARTVQRGLAAELDGAREKLHTVAEATVVVNSVLEDVGTVSCLSVPGWTSPRTVDTQLRV
jgi:hypothetical protein